MKNFACILLAVLFLLSGCDTSIAGPEDTSVPEATPASLPVSVEMPTVSIPDDMPLLQTDGTAMAGSGSVRIPYEGSISSVVYITDPQQLPDIDALKGYDGAYFAQKALLLIRESVSSGSTAVSVASVEDGVITLNHTLPQPGEQATHDMATWLLWVEVEAGLTQTWKIANSALASGLEAETS